MTKTRAKTKKTTFRLVGDSRVIIPPSKLRVRKSRLDLLPGQTVTVSGDDIVVLENLSYFVKE